MYQTAWLVENVAKDSHVTYCPIQNNWIRALLNTQVEGAQGWNKPSVSSLLLFPCARASCVALPLEHNSQGTGASADGDSASVECSKRNQNSGHAPLSPRVILASILTGAALHSGWIE